MVVWQGEAARGAREARSVLPKEGRLPERYVDR